MRPDATQGVPYRFTLFVAGDGPNSALAKENLAHICAEYLLTGVCTIEFIDITIDFQAALDRDVLLTPTLLVDGPRGRTTIVGNLSDVDRIVLAIGCN